VDDQIDRAKERTTLTYRIAPRLSLGIEYNPRARKASALANLVVMTETERRPALIAGTSSDRIGTPEGEAYFLTLSKNLMSVTGWPVSPYVGASYGTYEDELEAIGGVHALLGRGFETTIIHDGKELHPTLGYRFRQRHVLTLLWVATEDLGVSYSVVF
jgi:hypothetical protein